MIIQTLSGDIAQVKSDALITAINAAGMWAGGIDRVIYAVAGDAYHKQARAAMPLKDGQTIVARDPKRHRGTFKNVVFVVDERRLKLRQIVMNGLVAASDAQCTSVTLPAIRMGVMLGKVEKTVEEAVNELAAGVREFVKKHPATSITSITFAIYEDERLRKLLESALKQN